MHEQYADGLEEYPLNWVLLQNIFYVVYFGIAFCGMLPAKAEGFPFVSVLYAVFLLVMLIFVMRKHLCTNCYYYGKRCGTGGEYCQRSSSAKIPETMHWA